MGRVKKGIRKLSKISSFSDKSESSRLNKINDELMEQIEDLNKIIRDDSNYIENFRGTLNKYQLKLSGADVENFTRSEQRLLKKELGRKCDKQERLQDDINYIQRQLIEMGLKGGDSISEKIKKLKEERTSDDDIKEKLTEDIRGLIEKQGVTFKENDKLQDKVNDLIDRLKEGDIQDDIMESELFEIIFQNSILDYKKVSNEVLFDAMVKQQTDDEVVTKLIESEKTKIMGELLLEGNIDESKLSIANEKLRIMISNITDTLIDSEVKDILEEEEMDALVAKLFSDEKIKSLMVEQKLNRDVTECNQILRKERQQLQELKQSRQQSTQQSTQQSRQPDLYSQQYEQEMLEELTPAEEAAQRVRDVYKSPTYHRVASEMKKRGADEEALAEELNRRMLEDREEQKRISQIKEQKRRIKERQKRAYEKSIRNQRGYGGKRGKKKKYSKKTKRMNKTRRNRLKTRGNRLKTRRNRLKTRINRIKLKKDNLKTKKK